MNNNFKYFKGKSREDILKSIEGLSLEEKFTKALYNKIDWLINDCINLGVIDTFSLEKQFALGVNHPELKYLMRESLEKGFLGRFEVCFKIIFDKYIGSLACNDNVNRLKRDILEYLKLVLEIKYHDIEHDDLINFDIDYTAQYKLFIKLNNEFTKNLMQDKYLEIK